MSNFEQQVSKNFSLPPGYIIKLATKQDYWNIYKFELLSSKVSLWFIGFLYPISTVLMLPAGYTEWKMLQRSIAFEQGTQLLNSPDLLGWLYILLESLKFALFIPVILLCSFLASYLISYLLFNLRLNSRKTGKVYSHWIIKYRNQVVGHIKLKTDKRYSRITLLSIYPQHRNLGLGSYLVWKAIRNTKRPIYLACLPRLQSFYHRFGFVSLSKQRVPLELTRGSFKLMVLF